MYLKKSAYTGISIWQSPNIYMYVVKNLCLVKHTTDNCFDSCQTTVLTTVLTVDTTHNCQPDMLPTEVMISGCAVMCIHIVA